MPSVLFVTCFVNCRAAINCLIVILCFSHHSTTVFSHATTVVFCAACSTVLSQPTGGLFDSICFQYSGKAKLTEGCAFRRKND